MSSAILLIHCPDRKGLIVEVTKFLWESNTNITDLDEHVEIEDGVFFMRVVFELNKDAMDQEAFKNRFDEQVARKYQMKWNLHFEQKKTKMALFVSKSTHCLYDILSRHESSEWNVDIPAIISNHKDLAATASQFNIPFHHFEVNKANKQRVEQQQLQLLADLNVDFIVLARYMQILSESFIDRYKNKIINIHHSFLPAFPGARPYHQAHKRGVKIIGATSHYVTADLDAGPIIEQEIVKISHKDSVKELVRKGKDLEKIVLSRAIWSHLQRKTLVYDNKTIVFD